MPTTFSRGQILESSALNAAFSEDRARLTALENQTVTVVPSVILAAIEGETLTATLDGNADTATRLITAQPISLTGAVTGSATFDGAFPASITTTLSASGVTAGTYGNLTVDTSGRITAATVPDAAAEYVLTAAKIGEALGYNPISINASIVGNAATATVANTATVATTATKLATARTFVVAGDATGSATFDGTANATITATLASTSVTAGNYGLLSVDSKGRLTSARAMAAADVTGALGYTPAPSPTSINSTTAVALSGVTHRGKIVTLRTGASLSVAWSNTGDGFVCTVVNTTTGTITPTLTGFTATTITAIGGTGIPANGIVTLVCTTPDGGTTKVLRAYGNLI